MTGYADGIAHKLRAAGVPEDAPVGVVVGNRLPHAAAIVGLLAARRVPLSLNPWMGRLFDRRVNSENAF